MPTLEQGFTLPELMLAMAFGSLIVVAASQTFPVLRQQTVDAGRHYRLELVLRQLAFGIEKDLRRSGFCAGRCQGKALHIGNVAGEAPGSCVIMAYDLNRNGRWEKSGDAEYFGYRLRAGAFEGQRGVTHCRGGGWEALLDRDEVRIDAFTVSQQTGERGISLVRFALSGRSTRQESLQHRLEWGVRMGSNE